MIRLRGACSRLRVGSLASFFLGQHPSVKYINMQEHFRFEGENEIDHGMSDKAALACTREHYLQLRFVRDLQARCAWAEAKALAVSEILGPMRRGDHWQRAVLETLLPRDPRVVRAARRLAEQCPEHCAATVAGSFAAHQLQCMTAPRRGSMWGPQDLDVFLQSSAAYEEAIQCRHARRDGLPPRSRGGPLRLADGFRGRLF